MSPPIHDRITPRRAQSVKGRVPIVVKAILLDPSVAHRALNGGKRVLFIHNTQEKR
jgi:uncharacterized protein YbjT (DUF2867 family)